MSSHPAIHWRNKEFGLGNGHGELIGSECSACGEKAFPPRDVCPKCAMQSKEQLGYKERRQIGAMLLWTYKDKEGKQWLWLQRDEAKTEAMFDNLPQAVARKKRWAPVGGGITERDGDVWKGLAREVAEEVWEDESLIEYLHTWLYSEAKQVSTHPLVVNQLDGDGESINQFGVSVWHVEVDDFMRKELEKKGVWVPLEKVAASQNLIQLAEEGERYGEYKFRPHAPVAAALLQRQIEGFPVLPHELIVLNRSAITAGYKASEVLGGAVNNGVWNTDGTVRDQLPEWERAALGIQ